MNAIRWFSISRSRRKAPRCQTPDSLASRPRVSHEKKPRSRRLRRRWLGDPVALGDGSWRARARRVKIRFPDFPVSELACSFHLMNSICFSSLWVGPIHPLFLQNGIKMQSRSYFEYDFLTLFCLFSRYLARQCKFPRLQVSAAPTWTGPPWSVESYICIW